MEDDDCGGFMKKRDETEKLMTELISYIQAVKCEHIAHDKDGEAIYISRAIELEDKYKIWLAEQV